MMLNIRSKLLVVASDNRLLILIPTKDSGARSGQVPPTRLVDCSYSAYKEHVASRLPNPTNAVGGLFIPSLQRARRGLDSQIPPTQLVDCSYSAYKERADGSIPKSHQRSWWDCDRTINIELLTEFLYLDYPFVCHFLLHSLYRF
jgi:hypothetical protein